MWFAFDFHCLAFYRVWLKYHQQVHGIRCYLVTRSIYTCMWNAVVLEIELDDSLGLQDQDHYMKFININMLKILGILHSRRLSIPSLHSVGSIILALMKVYCHYVRLGSFCCDKCYIKAISYCDRGSDRILNLGNVTSLWPPNSINYDCYGLVRYKIEETLIFRSSVI